MLYETGEGKMRGGWVVVDVCERQVTSLPHPDVAVVAVAELCARLARDYAAAAATVL